MRSVDGDLTTKARIREAAIARFPEDGFAGTTVRAIAADAGVSPGLVLHHFGSKEELRRACDEHVLRLLDERKRASIRAGSYREAGAIAAAYQLVAPALRYLAWTLSTGGDAAARIFDEWLEDVKGQLEEAEEMGQVNPIEDKHGQAAVLVALQLGGIVLHEHVSRALGVDVLTPEGLVVEAPYALRLFSGELFNREVIEEASRAVDELQKQQETEIPA